jgi:hypothetical protein
MDATDTTDDLVPLRPGPWPHLEPTTWLGALCHGILPLKRLVLLCLGTCFLVSVLPQASPSLATARDLLYGLVLMPLLAVTGVGALRRVGLMHPMRHLDFAQQLVLAATGILSVSHLLPVSVGLAVAVALAFVIVAAWLASWPICPASVSPSTAPRAAPADAAASKPAAKHGHITTTADRASSPAKARKRQARAATGGKAGQPVEAATCQSHPLDAAPPVLDADRPSDWATFDEARQRWERAGA